MAHGLAGRGGWQVHGGELLGGQPHRGLHSLLYLAAMTGGNRILREERVWKMILMLKYILFTC